MVGHLRRGQQRVQRHHHQAGAHQAEVGEQELRDVRQLDRDLRSRSETEPQQVAGDQTGHLLDLRVADAGLTHDDAGLVGVGRRRLVQHGGEVEAQVRSWGVSWTWELWIPSSRFAGQAGVVEAGGSDLTAELWDACDAALSSRLAYSDGVHRAGRLWPCRSSGPSRAEPRRSDLRRVGASAACRSGGATPALTAGGRHPSDVRSRRRRCADPGR